MDIVHKFLCRPLPIDMFLLDPHPPNAACKARGQQKRKQRDESTLKWRDTFKEYAGKLGIVAQASFQFRRKEIFSEFMYWHPFGGRFGLVSTSKVPDSEVLKGDPFLDGS